MIIVVAVTVVAVTATVIMKIRNRSNLTKNKISIPQYTILLNKKFLS